MDTLEAIHQRYSCRGYQPVSISQHELDILLQAAREAPAACGRRDYLDLAVIQDPAFLSEWEQAAAEYLGAPKSHPLYHAKTVILISAYLGDDVPFANPYLNAGCMAENITLAATALGLGSVLLAAPVRALLQAQPLLAKLPQKEHFQPVIAVAIGYPIPRKD